MSTPRTILVPLDLSETAELVLDYAVAFAAKLGAKVHVLHVIGTSMIEAEGIPIAASIISLATNTRRNQLEGLAAARAAQVELGPPGLVVGDPRNVIVEQAVALRADLVIMGTHGRRGLARVFVGSVAESVARDAPCPVLLVRNGDR